MPTQNKPRPPLAFVLEGQGEFASFPTLVATLWGHALVELPRSKPNGCDSIVKHLEIHLDELVRLKHPQNILVTVDLQDIIDHGHFSDCVDALKKLNARIDSWKVQRNGHAKFDPLPDRIIIILQVRKLETWMISDLEGLRSHGAFTSHLGDHAWVTDVDSECSNPSKFIADHSDGTFDSKVPGHVKALFGTLDVDRMAQFSRSFRKFAKEVRACAPKY